MKNQTHIQAYRQAAEKQKQAICKLLRWDEMAYAEYQYQTGIAYLYWYLPCDKAARASLERSKLYWNWFKHQWDVHDEAFITSEGVELMHLNTIRFMYEALHCPKDLAVEIKPNDVVLNSIKKTHARYTILSKVSS